VAEAAADVASPPETIALAKVEPVPAPAEAPPFVPPPPMIALDGVPPDLQAPAPVAEPAPDFVLPATPELPTMPPPDLQVAAAEPARAAAPAPAFVLPTTPELPTEPPPDLMVAAIDPVVPPTEPPPAAPLLTPTIDAVEIEGDGNFIAGNGPAGATMRLYVDGVPVGMSPVEGGRWLVEGTDLLTEQRQTLKVEALDPLTGKVLGEATVAFERPVEPAAEQPVPVDEPAAAPAEQEDAAAETPAAEPLVAPAAPIVTEAKPAEVAEPVADETPPAKVPPLAPVVPTGESPSVTIVKPAGDATTITTLPTGKPSDDAVITLGARPDTPAIIAQFTVPEADPAPDVAVLRAVPIGDPGAGRFVSGKAITRRGDTLWDIAHRYYGRGAHYRTIFRANRDLIARPGKIYPGQVFDLPLVYDD
jgi:nucleoid-associated protein YgaU